MWLTLTGREKKNNDNGNGSKKDKWDGGGLRSVTPFPPWCVQRVAVHPSITQTILDPTE